MKNSTKRKLQRYLFILSLLVVPFTAQSTIRYIRPGAGAGTHPYDTWAKASGNIQTVIDACVDGDNIYIASGTINLPQTIHWWQSINIYGGFTYNSSETPETRKRPVNGQAWEFTNPTILNGNGTFRILHQSFAITNSFFDGFTIQNGSPVVNGKDKLRGGGARLLTGGTLINSIIQNSTAFEGGGGVFMENGGTVKNSLIINNNATTNSYIGGGGVIMNDNSKLINCYVTNNSADNHHAGGVYIEGGNGTPAQVINCVINNNYAKEKGGGLFIYKRGHVINSTVARNETGSNAGPGRGIHTWDADDVKIYNTVFWQNIGDNGSHIVYTNGFPTVDYCAEDGQTIYGGTATSSFRISNNNTSVEAGSYNPPHFKTPTATNGRIHGMTSANVGNWDIESNSSLVDKGKNSYNPINYDFNENNRKVGTIDIGAYEVQITTIDPSNIVISDATKTYNGTGQSPTITITPNVGYKVEYKKQGEPTSSYSTTKPINAGSYDVKITVTQEGYSGSKTGTFTISKKSITSITFPDQTKEYDGKLTAAPIAYEDFKLVDIIINDDVEVKAYSSAQYNNLNAGLSRTVTVEGIEYKGTAKDNYNITTTALNSSSKIDKKSITITADEGQTKVYDKNSSNPASYTYTHTGLADGDTFTGELSRNSGETAGSYPITIGTLKPTNPDNYEVTFVSKDFVITKKELTITGATAKNKVYDATTTATIEGGAINGIVGDDVVNFTVTSAEFVDKNAGTDINITTTFTLIGGAVINNYTLTQPNSFKANITKRELEAVGFSIKDKQPIPGNFDAEIDNWGTLQVVPDQDVGKVAIKQAGVTATFLSDEAGSHPVTLSVLELEGDEADNYTLKQPSGDALIGIISTSIANFDWSGENVSITYNGLPYSISVKETNSNTDATIEYDHNNGDGYVANEPIDAGTYSVRATSVDLTYKGSKTITLTINKKAIPAATFADGTKVYDNTTNVNPQPTLILTDIEDRDDVTATGNSAKYDTKDVGTNKTVTINNVVLTGTGSSNYTIPSVATNSNWSITKRDYEDVPFEITFADQTKVFDGTTTVKKNGIEVIPTISISGFISGDHFTAEADSASYDNAKAGTGKTVTLYGITYSDDAAKNYNLPTEIRNDNCIITKLNSDNILGGFDLSFDPQEKVYDGTTAVKNESGDEHIPTITISGLLPDFDNVTATYANAKAEYDNKNVGEGKTVTISDIEYSGMDVDNYTLPTSVSLANSKITPLSITNLQDFEIIFDAQSKVYDGTRAVIDRDGANYVPPLQINGLISGDDVSATGANAQYDTKHVGKNKIVTVSGISYTGEDSDNYTLPNSASIANGAITPIDYNTIDGFEITFDPQTKIYDGTTSVKKANGEIYVPALQINGLLASDVVTATGADAQYEDKNVGDEKEITVTGITYGGANAANYTLPTEISRANNEIDRKPITITPIEGQVIVQEDEYLYIDFSVAPELLDNKEAIKGELQGELSWDEIFTLGAHEILQGTLTNENNPNYDISFTSSINFELESNIKIIRKWGYVLLVDNHENEFASYQWYKNGVALNGETNQYYEGENKTLCGVYSCEVTYKNGQKFFSPEYEYLDGCNSLKSIVIYPNPVNINADYNIIGEGYNAENQEYIIELFTMQGQLIEKIKTDRIDRVKLNAPTLAGIYLVRVVINNEESAVFKMNVKN